MKNVIISNITREDFTKLCIHLNCKTLLEDIDMYYEKYLLRNSNKYYLGFYLPIKEYLLKDIGTIDVLNVVSYKNIIN